ncbi:hypothetical protein D3C86_1632730 [compost metagenome]
MLALGARVGGVVVPRRQFGEELGQVAGMGHGLPRGDGVLAVQRLEVRELVRQPLRPLAEVGVVPQQEVQPRRQRRLDLHAGRGAHAGDQRHRQVQLADPRAFALYI